jgi:uncharacterized protein with HEPN domain
MRRDDAIRIRHMIEAAEACERFVARRSRTDLEPDLMLRFALVRAAEVFGEAASKVSLETRGSAPEIPWREIVAIRNRLIHAYFDIDHDVLWEAATGRDSAALERIARDFGRRLNRIEHRPPRDSHIPNPDAPFRQRSEKAEGGRPFLGPAALVVPRRMIVSRGNPRRSGSPGRSAWSSSIPPGHQRPAR